MVREKNPYPGKTIVKKECVGHIQKRCGTRLRALKTTSGHNKLIDGKTIGGRGRLSKTNIDTLQNYFGLAIRGNKGDLANMKRDIVASLYHVASTDAKPQHQHCPSGENSWCGYQRDVANKTSTYKHKHGIADAVVNKVKPIYDALTKDEDLQGALDCLTQNANESINNFIWRRIPKHTYVGRKTLELGVASAVGYYNDGSSYLLDVLNKLNCPIGPNATDGAQKSWPVMLKTSWHISIW